MFEDKDGILCIDHGRNTETDELVIMPQIPLSWVGVGYHEDDMLHYDQKIGEYILNE